jgi:hypothetical protein
MSGGGEPKIFGHFIESPTVAAIQQTIMNRRRLLLCGTVALLAGYGLYRFIPVFYFDTAKPAVSRDIEYVNGKPAAWGPRPRIQSLTPDSWHTGYTGEEWALVHHRDYCRAWCVEHGYAYAGDAPSQPTDTTLALPGGVSPGGKFEVVLEADKGSPRYKAYEFKGAPDQFPAFLIREAITHRVLNRIRWMGDAGSDERPLIEHSSVSWSPGGNSVAINTHERFYARTSVWTLAPAVGSFEKAEFPDYKTLTGFDEPDPDQLRARGYAHVDGWTAEGHLIYTLILSSGGDYAGHDPLHHRVTLEVSATGMKVLLRQAIKSPE